MAFIKGSKVIEQQLKSEEEARKANRDPSRLGYWGIGEGEESLLRFLTDADEFIHVKQHSSCKTKPAPKDATKWPQKMSAVCRYDPQFAEYGYEGCYICDNKLQNSFGAQCFPNTRVWALAVQRHVVDEKVVDLMESVDLLDEDGKPTGKKEERPTIVLVNQPWSIFFSSLHHIWLASGPIESKRTLLNRDIFIRRTGDGKDTAYGISQMDSTPEHAPGTASWEVYTNSLAKRGIDLEKTLVGLTSDEHYARWFDVTKSVDKDGKITGSGATISDSTPTMGEYGGESEVSEAVKAKLDRLRGKTSATA